MKAVRALRQWFQSRLGLGESLGPILRHPVPPGAHWGYVFGSASMSLLLLQMVTGMCLALVYVPAADEAYKSLEYLNRQQELGWFLRAVHFWGASAMVVMVILHMTQVFLFGAYKYPRELTWMVGVGLLVLTLAMGFTGQVLRWDQDAYWGIAVGSSMAGRVPVLGRYLVHMLLGGPTIGGETLSRFFTLHVFVIPALLLGSLALHLYLVLRHGISEPPVAGEPVIPSRYREWYESVLERGEPFFPGPVLRDAVFSALTVVLVVLLSATLGPYGPAAPPDPTVVDAEPRPEWYFLPLFALLALSPPALETWIILGAPALVIGGLLAVPLVFNAGEKHWTRRLGAVVVVAFLYVSIGTLGWLGYRSPWSPIMSAWTDTPVPAGMVRGRSPRELAGAAVLQNKNCRNCHALDGKGGQRGPDLTNVASRLSQEELIRQVIQGGGDMPAYGQELSPDQVQALVSFLETLKSPTGVRPRAEPVGPAPALPGGRGG